MIRYIWRTLPVVARALVAREPGLISRLERRVGLGDLDTNGHMNQAVYAQVMELGRADLLIRSGALKALRRSGLKAAVASQRIVYRRELKRGTRYLVDSRCVGMNGRLLVMQSHLIVGDRVHARADVEVIFFGPGGVLDADTAAERCVALFVEPLRVDDWRLVDAPG